MSDLDQVPDSDPYKYMDIVSVYETALSLFDENHSGQDRREILKLKFPRYSEQTLGAIDSLAYAHWVKRI